MKPFLRDPLERRTVLVRLKSFGLKWVLGKAQINPVKGLEWKQRFLMDLLKRWTVCIRPNARLLQYLHWRPETSNVEVNSVSYFSIQAMFLQYFKRSSIMASRSTGPMTARNQFVPSSSLSRLHGDMRENHSKEKFAPIFHRSGFLNVPGTPNRHWNIPRYGALSQKSMEKKSEGHPISSVRGTIPGHRGFNGSERGQRWIRAVDGFFQNRGSQGYIEGARSSQVLNQGTSWNLMKAMLPNRQNYWKFSYLSELIVRNKSRIHHTPIRPPLYAADFLGNHLNTFRKKYEQDQQQEEMINVSHSNLQVKVPIGDEEVRKIIVGKFGSPSLVMRSERAAAHGIPKNVKRGPKEIPWKKGATQEANMYPSLFERRIYPGETFLTLQTSNANWLPLKGTPLETHRSQISYGSLNILPLNTVFAHEQSVRRSSLAFLLSKKTNSPTNPIEIADNKGDFTGFSGGEEIHVNGKSNFKRMLRFLNGRNSFPGTLGQPKFQNWKIPKKTVEGSKEQSLEMRHDLAYVPIRNQNFQARVGSDVKMVSPEEGRFDRLEMGKALIPLNRETNESTSPARGNTLLSRTVVQQIAERVYHLLLDRVKRERELWRR